MFYFVNSFIKVKGFAQKTGDFISLSETDLEIIAIAYTFAEENGNISLLRKTPPQPQTYIPQNKEKNENKEDATKNNNEISNNIIDKSQANEKKDEQNTNIANEGNEKQNTNEMNNIHIAEDSAQLEKKLEDLKENDTRTTEEENNKIENKEENHENEQSSKDKEIQSDSEDDEAGWINPDNISKHIFNSVKVEETDNKIGVAIMTADFAMQVKSFHTIKKYILFRMLFYKLEYL